MLQELASSSELHGVTQKFVTLEHSVFDVKKPVRTVSKKGLPFQAALLAKRLTIDMKNKTFAPPAPKLLTRAAVSSLIVTGG